MIQADIVGTSESSLESSGQSHSHVDLSDQLWSDVMAEGTAEWLSSMEALNPKLIRSVPAYAILFRLGGALRKGSISKQLYTMSKETTKIDEFWSHSWHVEPWKKILCLLFLNNGMPATIFGTGASLLGCALTLMNILPQMPFQVSLWGTVFGVLSYLVVLLFWHPRQEVFLDVGCIDQSHPQKKVEGVLSMGGILKHSTSMLVLWDVSFVERLWCIFELAGFIKSHSTISSTNPPVVIRPVLFGPCALAVFGFTCLVMFMMIFLFSLGLRATLLPAVGGMFFFILYPAAATFRHYFHSMDTLASQLRDFRIAESKCYCCSSGHVNPKNPCDREIVCRCIGRWFVSERTFEDYVRAFIPLCFSKQLGRYGFPYWLLLVATAPMFWALLDLAVAHWLQQDQFWQFWLGAAGGWWLGAHPLAAAHFFWGAKVLRKPASNRCGDILKNLLVIAQNLPVLMVTFGLNEIIILFQFPAYLTTIIASSIHISLAALVWFAPDGLRFGQKKTSSAVYFGPWPTFIPPWSQYLRSAVENLNPPSKSLEFSC